MPTIYIIIISGLIMLSMVAVYIHYCIKHLKSERGLSGKPGFNVWMERLEWVILFSGAIFGASLVKLAIYGC